MPISSSMFITLYSYWQQKGNHVWRRVCCDSSL